MDNEMLKTLVRNSSVSGLEMLEFKPNNSLFVSYRGNTRLAISFDSAKDRAKFHQEILDKMLLEAQ